VLKTHSEDCFFSVEYVESLRVLSIFEERAVNHTETITRLVDEMLLSVTNEVAVCFPDKRSLYMIFSRIRNKNLRMPPSLSEFVVDGSECLTVDGGSFLIGDEWVGSDRVMMFGSEIDCRRLCESELVAMDGTFDVCPSLFYQLYSIHSFTNDKMVARVFCLMTGKSVPLYRKMVRMLKDFCCDRLGVSFAPCRVCLDFEKAVIRVMREEFPGISIDGCLFHHSNACLRYVKTNGMYPDYKRTVIFRTYVRMLMSLPFLELSDIERCFFLLKSRAEVDCVGVLPFFHYFENEWMNDLSVWNVYGRALRTNNHVEGWHLRFSRIVCVSHPNVWRLLECLKGEERLNRLAEIRMDAMIEGPRRRNVTYERLNESIVRLCSRYDSCEITVCKFLYSVSYKLLHIKDRSDGSLTPFANLGLSNVDFFKSSFSPAVVSVSSTGSSAAAVSNSGGVPAVSTVGVSSSFQVVSSLTPQPLVSPVVASHSFSGSSVVPVSNSGGFPTVSTVSVSSLQVVSTLTPQPLVSPAVTSSVVPFTYSGAFPTDSTVHMSSPAPESSFETISNPVPDPHDFSPVVDSFHSFAGSSVVPVSFSGGFPMVSVVNASSSSNVGSMVDSSVSSFHAPFPFFNTDFIPSNRLLCFDESLVDNDSQLNFATEYSLDDCSESVSIISPINKPLSVSPSQIDPFNVATVIPSIKRQCTVTCKCNRKRNNKKRYRTNKFFKKQKLD